MRVHIAATARPDARVHLAVDGWHLVEAGPELVGLEVVDAVDLTAIVPGVQSSSDSAADVAARHLTRRDATFDDGQGRVIGPDGLAPMLRHYRAMLPGAALHVASMQLSNNRVSLRTAGSVMAFMLREGYAMCLSEGTRPAVTSGTNIGIISTVDIRQGEVLRLVLQQHAPSPELVEDWSIRAARGDFTNLTGLAPVAIVDVAR